MTSLPVSSSQSPNQILNKGLALKAEDFIKMMVTQLQHQDPLSPAKNEELLAQMSQIGQLQSSTQLQDSLKSMVLQNQIGSAGNLIGKQVQGVDENNELVDGQVTSVRVEKDQVNLELDNGKTLALNKVTTIAGAPVGGGATASAAPGAAG
jgi:flagellar basal-body rod modification protein FlgD